MPSLHPMSDYSRFNLPTTPAGTPLDLTPTVLDDIPGRFGRISTAGDVLGCRDGGAFTSPREHRYTGENVQGVDAAINHCQGVIRLGRARDAFLVISAGDSTEPVSQLFIGVMGSRPVNGPWGSNLRLRGLPGDSDCLIRVVALETRRWHPGGMGVLGDVLAVPVEGDGTSAVRFLHLADPANPTHLPITIERPEFPNAGAAGLGRLPDGRVICFVWREQGSRKPIGRIDYYVSTDPADLFAGFGPATTIEFPGFPEGQDRDPKYQSVMLLHPPPGAGRDPILYLLATENEAPDAPFGNGKNLADLFAILPPAARARGGTAIGQIRHVATGTFRAPRPFCNFDAAAGGYVDVTPGGPGLHLYGGFHWRLNRTFQLAEFAGRPDPAVELTDEAEAWIELYEHDGFRGRRLTVYGQEEASIPDYSRIFVEDGDFDRRVSSVRWQIPAGFTYRLFRGTDFTGAAIELEGNGLLREIPDLSRRSFGDVVMSSRFASRTRAAAPEPPARPERSGRSMPRSRGRKPRRARRRAARSRPARDRG